MGTSPHAAVADPKRAIEDWRNIIRGSQKSWVLFRYGTCVLLMEPQEDMSSQAVELLREWGPVYPGSPAGDFNVVHLTNYSGWVITGHHPDVVNYVALSEVPEGSDDATIGLLGRSKRHQDSIDLRVIHVEDKRGAA